MHLLNVAEPSDPGDHAFAPSSWPSRKRPRPSSGTSTATSFFTMCPSGYMCASSIRVVPVGHMQQETASEPNKDADGLTFEEGCPAEGYLNARNICVPTNDPSPVKSRDEFRPCKTWSNRGYDEAACSADGITGCVCVLKQGAVETLDPQSHKRAFLLPGVHGEGAPVSKNPVYKIEVDGGQRKEIPFDSLEALKLRKTSVAKPAADNGTMPAPTAGVGKTPTVHVLPHYRGDLRTGLQGVTDTAWSHNLVSYIQGGRFLFGVSPKSWLGHDPRILDPQKRVLRVSRSVRAARNILRDLVKMTRELGLNLRMPVAGQQKETFCTNLKQDPDKMWQIAEGLRFVQRANLACLRVQESALKMMGPAAGPQNPGAPQEDTPFVTKADLLEKVPECLRNEKFEMPWKHVFARIATEAADCTANVEPGTGKFAVARGIFQNLFVE
eukprot:CAMPEP_0178996396 /NCGR_PEP_ID=MMETSP0795-20121207/8346_1 /TAXON_ID=88552 /ORGANISM="Amoebophrya sp., Strain Ameob2" /LENGTH=439 /DNA_ID=CAMNT_0020688783 /DNA_START=104 /DNA_END=1423 /DNA_ORIENTATION=-